MARTGAVFLVPAILHLAVVLPGRPLSLRWKVCLSVDYGYSIVLALLNLSGLLVERLAEFEWGYYSVGTAFYNLFAAQVLVSAAVSIAVLVREYLTTSVPRMRLQLKFWLLGVTIALPLGLTNLLPSYGLPFYPLGNVGSVIWAAIVGYAIVRYRLMDIEVLVTRVLAYISTIVLIVSPVFLLSLVLQGVAFGEIHYDFSTALAILLTLVGVAFSALHVGIERRLENALFPARVASRMRLSALGGQVVRILDRDRLLDLLTHSVSSAFSLDRIALYLQQGPRSELELVRWLGPKPDASAIAGDGALARWLRRVGEAVIREEAEGTDTRSGGGGVGPVLVANQWEVCVPFVGGQDLLGFMALGRKHALQAYAVGDLDLLSQVAAEASIALHNARLYEELRHSREIISRTGRLSAIGTLAAGIAHEIRNPLVSIQTFFQLAPDRLDDEEFMTSFLGLAENEVRRISDLVSELLTFAKSPSATVREVDPSEIIDRAVALLEPQARSGRVRIERPNSVSAPVVLGDSDQLMQVLLNVILNALQASPPNGIVRIITGEEEREGEIYCQIAVTDQGEGIPKSIRESIFDPFFTTKEKGSGLGLAICHQIILESGGFMAVDTTEGEGSTFSVYLPAVGRLNDTAASGA
jgi:two-component system nitrogen regulation sensor histidine kinase GlnL